MKRYDNEASLSRLIGAIPPPQHPLETTGHVSLLHFTDGQQVVFPPDYLRLIDAYGSGDFTSDERYGEGTIGDILHLRNACAPGYQTCLMQESSFLREYKESEGDRYVPYAVYPDKPGILPWGGADFRLSYFWLTEGKPEQWPVLLMHDLEIWTRFDMPMTVFLEQLLFGEINCSCIGWRGEYSRRNPAHISFRPRIQPGG
jgi:hypothetical protein